MKKRTGNGCSRRDFIKYSASAAAIASLQWKRMLMAAPAVVGGPYGAVSPALTKFVDPIRLIAADIPVMTTNGAAPVTGVPHYTIDISEFTDDLHPDLTKLAGYTGTKLRGYGQGGNHKHLGGVIVTQRDQPLQITFNNNLPSREIIPTDFSIPQPASLRTDRTAVHLHGGHVHWISDGGPFDWWAPDGTNAGTGTPTELFFNNLLNPGAAPNQAEYYYPNDQSARFMWYHDHAWGITRTNAYSGIASGYVIFDPIPEAALVSANGGAIPTTLNSDLFYVVFQDKIFFGGTPPADYGANAGPGDLFYAYQYNPALFGPPGPPSFGQPLLSPPPIPSCVPEFFGDTILANGTAYPFLEVEARPIRIRMLNACNARFLNPRLVATAGQKFPDNAEPSPSSLGPGFIQIGTEGGYLPFAVPLSGAPNSQLLLAPAERADILIDFSKVKPGKEFILYNDAPGPYPGGAGIFDYYPKNGKTPWSTPGFGPNTRTLLKIRVKTPTTPVTPLPKTINTAVANLSDPLLVVQTPGVPTPIPAVGTVIGGATVAQIRTLTLNEGFDEYGRLAQYIGPNFQAPGAVAGFYGHEYLHPPTEIAQKGTIEVWQILNLTADAHPIHFHLSNVQILYRQAAQTKGFTGVINPTGGPIAPDLNELGFKETVRMNPGEVTVVIMKFDIPPDPNGVTIPPSTRTGVSGAEYVVHCHILEHEEHDMMRPLIVQ
jgi:spore coat protein A